MIGSADEFRRLRISDDAEDQRRASLEPADERVWIDVIEHYPDLRKWVAHNKTVPLSILGVLATDPDPDVRYFVAMKRKLDRRLFDLLAGDPDASVRIRIAWNPKTPLDLLTKLATDPDDFVAKSTLERTQRDAEGMSA